MKTVKAKNRERTIKRVPHNLASSYLRKVRKKLMERIESFASANGD